MRLNVRLTLTFGALLIGITAALTAVLYHDVRGAFLERSSQQAQRLAAAAVGRAELRAEELTRLMNATARRVSLGILLNDAGSDRAAQRRLIDELATLTRVNNLAELTAIGPGGTVLARGHARADFGGTADSAPLGELHLADAAGAGVLRLRLPVDVQGELVGVIEGGVELRDILDELGALFGGDVTLAADARGLPPGVHTTADASLLRGSIRFSTVVPWTRAGGNVIAHLVLARTDVDTLQALRRFLLRALAVLALIFALGAAALWKLSAAVTEPLRKLTLAASQISQGRRDLDLPAPGGDEIGELSRSFGRMAGSLDETREKLLAAERLGAWQDAARMLAHEIKNPLSPIKTTAGTLARAAEQSDPQLAALAQQGARTVLAEIAQLEKLLAEFTSFARFPAPKLAPADLDAVVRDTVAAFRAGDPRIRWDERLGGGARVALDDGLFREVLKNLFLNAADAMGGTAANIIRIETSRDGDTAVVTVADNGPGIDASKRADLFKPYFTTKSHGTGLGLAVCRKIMIEHGGDIRLLDASPWPDINGAAFQLKLPIMVKQEP